MTQRTSSRFEFPCPHCGELVPAGARSCRECGASEECGWNDSDLAIEDTGDDEFDYDDFVAREFPEHADPDSPTVTRQAWIAWIIALLIAAMLLSTVWW